MRRIKVRLFADHTIESTSKLLGCSEEVFLINGIDLEFNTSGKADLVVVLNTTSCPRWVWVSKGNVIKVLQEPLIKNPLTHLFTYYHSGIYDQIFTHSPDATDGRQKVSLPCTPFFVDPTLTKQPLDQKTHLLSVIASTLTILPGHRIRTEFIQDLLTHFPELEHHTYGRGRKQQLVRKEDGLNRYRYSVAIENSRLNSYVTEKFYDCIIAGCVPLYFGAPNIADYFPKDSFIALPIDDIRKCRQIIQNLSISDYESRIPALIEAQSLVRDEYSLGAVILRHAAEVRQNKPSRHRLIFLMRFDGFLIWIQKLSIVRAIVRRYRSTKKLFSKPPHSYQ